MRRGWQGWEPPLQLPQTSIPETIDYRDPKLVATPDVLYCFVGAYTPAYPATTLSAYSGDNILQSYVAYTYDGKAWSPFVPIARPTYWVWSILPTKDYWICAAYHTGVRTDSSSIHLFTGRTPLRLTPAGVIYDGANLSRDGKGYAYPSFTPSEPVLMAHPPLILACYVRTDSGMNIGVCHPSLAASWRWQATTLPFHPSDGRFTKYGPLLAGREIRSYYTKGQEHTSYHTSLYHMQAQYPVWLLDLPSAYDTGYAGLAETDLDDEYLLSWYSQHSPAPTVDDAPLPGSSVFVARLKILP